MFNILSHWGNGSKAHNEMAHTCHNDYNQTQWQDQMLAVMWETRSHIHSKEEYKMLQLFWKTLVVSYKTKHVITIWPAFTLLGVFILEEQIHIFTQKAVHEWE